MLSRATSMPASTRDRIPSGVFTAGPRVQTIFALRTAPPYRRLDRSKASDPRRAVGEAGFREEKPVSLTARDGSDDERALVRLDRRRERRRAGEVGVDGRGGAAPLGDRPDDQRLSAPHVAGDVDPGDRGGVRRVAPDVATLVEVHPELVDQAGALRPGALGTGEAHREQHQLRRDLPLGALDGLEPRIHLDQPERGDVTLVVADE